MGQVSHAQAMTSLCKVDCRSCEALKHTHVQAASSCIYCAAPGKHNRPGRLTLQEQVNKVPTWIVAMDSAVQGWSFLLAEAWTLRPELLWWVLAPRTLGRRG